MGIRWAVHIAFMGKTRNAYNVLVGKPEGKRRRRRLGPRWKDNIRMDLREIVWQVVDWIHLAQDMDHCRGLVNTVMNLRVLLKVRNFFSSLVVLCFLRRALLHEVTYLRRKLRSMIAVHSVPSCGRKIK
jgi:hypothetical protein